MHCGGELKNFCWGMLLETKRISAFLAFAIISFYWFLLFGFFSSCLHFLFPSTCLNFTWFLILVLLWNRKLWVPLMLLSMIPQMGHQQYADNLHSESSLCGEPLTTLGILQDLYFYESKLLYSVVFYWFYKFPLHFNLLFYFEVAR